MDRSADTLLHLTGGVDATVRLPTPMPRTGTVPVVILCPDLAPPSPSSAGAGPETGSGTGSGTGPATGANDDDGITALDWLDAELAAQFGAERHAVARLEAAGGGRPVDAAGLVAALEAAPRELASPPLDAARATVVAIGLAATAAAAAASAWLPSTRLVLVAP
ncbi:MAG: hypothetical protein KDA22_06500, partial [Phycisphaerales bacterium]|nr:hypothetical protein [Phycisphaerales bacterium]